MNALRVQSRELSVALTEFSRAGVLRVFSLGCFTGCQNIMMLPGGEPPRHPMG